ncbi:hypothetical protein ACVPOW_05310 [Staphylococcus aureus]
MSSNDSEEVMSDSTKTDTNVLTEATMFKIDPMINMEYLCRMTL